MEKKCIKCNIVKSLDDFNKDSKSKDGRQNQCRDCQKSYHFRNRDRILKRKKEYYEENKQDILSRQKEWVIENKEEISRRRKVYSNKNAEKIREKSKKWRENNPNGFKDYYRENKDKILAKSKKWKKDNKEAVREYRREYQRRKRNEDPVFRLRQNLRNRTCKIFVSKSYSKKSKTKEMLGINYDELKRYIEQKFESGMNWGNYGKWHIDHIIPLASAETEEELITLCHYTNLQPLWAEDNLAKSDKLDWRK